MKSRQEHDGALSEGGAGGGKSKRGRPPSKRAVQISISIPQSLVDIVDEMAESENRNRSNFISAALKRMAEDFSRLEK